MMKTDSELQRDVLEELVWEPNIDATEISVLALGGVVVLNGIVKSLNHKWMAESVAQRVDGVQAVTDELTVQLPGDSWRSDADIAQAALNGLDWNGSVPRNRIKVLVDHGWITLQGNVEFHFQKEAAEAAVRDLKGVRGVSSLIDIQPRVFAGDVTREIKKALHRAAQVDAERISVEAREGMVILSGTVKTWAERQEAERAAWAAPGVTAIENDIRIRLEVVV